MDAIQPQHLVKAPALRLGGSPVGGGVVPAALGIAGTTPDRPDVGVLNEDVHRLETAGEVAPHWGENDHHLRPGNRMEPQVNVGAELYRPDVQGGAGQRRHPVLIQLHQLQQGFQQKVRIKIRQLDALGAVPHPPHIVRRAKQLHTALIGAVGFEAFKHLGAVVEHSGTGMDREICQRHDLCIVPALLPIVVHGEHMVGKHGAKAQLPGVLRLGPGMLRLTDPNFHYRSLSLFPGR